MEDKELFKNGFIEFKSLKDQEDGETEYDHRDTYKVAFDPANGSSIGILIRKDGSIVEIK